MSVPVVLEYEAVLKRPGLVTPILGRGGRRARGRLCAIVRRRTLVFLWRPQLPGPADDAVLELAVASGSAPVVTWNDKHFRGAERFGVAAVTPLALLRDVGAIP